MKLLGAGATARAIAIYSELLSKLCDLGAEITGTVSDPMFFKSLLQYFAVAKKHTFCQVKISDQLRGLKSTA